MWGPRASGCISSISTSVTRRPWPEPSTRAGRRTRWRRAARSAATSSARPPRKSCSERPLTAWSPWRITAATSRCTRHGATAGRRWNGSSRPALALGQTCAGVTDHGYGLPIASGMSMEAVGPAARRHRRAQRAAPGRVPALQGDRSEHPRRRPNRHGARRAAPFRVRGRLAPFRAAQSRRPDRPHGRRGVAPVRRHSRTPAGPPLRRAPRRLG